MDPVVPPPGSSPEALPRRIIETTHEGVWLSGFDGITTFMNPQMARMLKTTPGQALGRSVFEFLFPEDHANVRSHFEGFRRSPAGMEVEERLRCADGSEIWTLVAASIFDGDDQTPAGYLGMFANITDRKKVAAQLQENQARLALQIRRMPIAHIVWNTEFLIESWNPAAEQMFGYPAAEALGRHTFDLILADYRLQGFTALDAWEALLQTVPPPPFILVSGAIGEELAVQAIQLGISDFVNKSDLARLPLAVDRALASHQAKIDKEQAIQALAASQRKMAEFANHLQVSIEAERASIAREIHDDIGGSLVAAKLDIAWVTRHATDKGVLAHLDSANDMLIHAMGASQRIMMALRPSILDQGLAAAVQWLAERFTKRTGTPTHLRVSPGLGAMEKNIELVAYRVAQESLTNASKYADCTSVSIDVSDAKGVLTVEICDDGAGLSPGDLEKSTAFGLRGLQERAQTVGGWLDISSTKGLGTTVILSIPLELTAHAADWDTPS